MKPLALLLGAVISVHAQTPTAPINGIVDAQLLAEEEYEFKSEKNAFTQIRAKRETTKVRLSSKNDRVAISLKRPSELTEEERRDQAEEQNQSDIGATNMRKSIAVVPNDNTGRIDLDFNPGDMTVLEAAVNGSLKDMVTSKKVTLETEFVRGTLDDYKSGYEVVVRLTFDSRAKFAAANSEEIADFLRKLVDRKFTKVTNADSTKVTNSRNVILFAQDVFLRIRKDREILLETEPLRAILHVQMVVTKDAGSSEDMDAKNKAADEALDRMEREAEEAKRAKEVQTSQ